MRKNLGKITIFLFSITSLFAEDFIYDIKVDNRNPYLKEGIIFSLELNQTNPDMVLFFNFDIKKSDDYEFIRLDSIESDTYHNATAKYLYLIYPLRQGGVDIEFELIKKVTNDDSIAYSYSGDRDNVKTLVTKDTPTTLPTVSLEVKPLPKDTLFVGDFKLSHNIKKHQAKAYEPIPFNITLEGIGYPPLLNSILPKDGEFTKFTEKPIVNSKATKRGTHNKIVYPMAISHSKSFEVDSTVFKSFNPKTEKSYELSIPKQKFEIEEIAVDTLIDKRDFPAIEKTDWSWINTFFTYLLVFVAGYLTAINIKWIKEKFIKKEVKKENLWEKRVGECRDKKELLQLLMATNNKKFSTFIESLDGALYRGKKIDFKKIKRQVVEI